MEPLTTTTQWTFTQKIFFRFASLFIFLSVFPVLFLDAIISALPDNKPALFDQIFEQANRVNRLWVNTFNALINIIPATKKLFPPDVKSWDEWYSYALLFMIVLVSVAGCLIWSLLDRRRKNYSLAYLCLNVFTRYFLAVMMLAYGSIKVFGYQMAFPTPSNLVTMMGDYWPQKLAWNFMGYSKAYQMFSGWGEVIGGLLLFWRRTTLLGTLILIPVLAIVFMMNLCFDIHVKTDAFLYLLLAFFLLIPYRRQLIGLLLKNSVVNPVVYPISIKNIMAKKIGAILKYTFIAFIVFFNIYKNAERGANYRKVYARIKAGRVLYGIYNTQLFIRNHDTIPLLITDTSIWKQMIFDAYGVSIKKMNDSTGVYMRKVDTVTHTLSIRPYYSGFHGHDTLHKSEWHYQKTGELLSLNGIYNGDSVQVLLKWYDHEKMRLPSWGFRWIGR